MSQYHKIQSVFKRDPDNNFKTFLEDEFALDAFKALWDGVEWQAHEKLDGMNMRAVWMPETQCFRFAGKTDNAQIPGDLLEFMQEHVTRERMLATSPDLAQNPVTFYGEGIGPGIQKGGYYGDQKQFVMFDIRSHSYWHPQADVTWYADSFGVDRARLIMEGYLYEIAHFIEHGAPFKALGSDDHQAEGVVCRPCVELADGFGNRMITKLKYKDFGRA